MISGGYVCCVCFVSSIELLIAAICLLASCKYTLVQVTVTRDEHTWCVFSSNLHTRCDQKPPQLATR